MRLHISHILTRSLPKKWNQLFFSSKLVYSINEFNDSEFFLCRYANLIILYEFSFRTLFFFKSFLMIFIRSTLNTYSNCFLIVFLCFTHFNINCCAFFHLRQYNDYKDRINKEKSSLIKKTTLKIRHRPWTPDFYIISKITQDILIYRKIILK